MTAIPINPAAIANCGSYTANGNATSINLCKQPNEGAKSISMQFAFNQKPGWLVNFPNFSNGFSQLCSLYVDATNSEFDVTIYFPDSGYSARINAQGSRMIPVITGATQNSLPAFYVLLDSGGVLTSDIVNVIALNTFVPEFEANELQNVLSYGYGQLFTPQPNFTQSGYFHASSKNLSGAPFTIIAAHQWYITAIFLTVFTNSTMAGTPTFTLYDNGVIILTQIFNVPVGINALNICQATGLNLISSGNGPLTAIVNATAGITDAQYDATIMGGILIP